MWKCFLRLSAYIHTFFVICLITLTLINTVPFCCTNSADQCIGENTCENLATFESESRKTMTTQTHGHNSNTPGNENTQLAVVLYNEDSILPLHKPERSFMFVGRELTIKQNWADLGVAAVVWDAAVVLCEYLEQHPDIVRGKSAVELGAGTGLVAIVAAILGSRITVTDRGVVMQFLRETVERNLNEEELKSTKIRELDWTIDLDKYDDTYDVILGADVVYVEEVFDDLLKTLVKLSNSETLILLSCRIRYDRDIRFLTKMEGLFNIEEILYDTKTDVKLFRAIQL